MQGSTMRDIDFTCDGVGATRCKKPQPTIDPALRRFSLTMYEGVVFISKIKLVNKKIVSRH